MTDDAKLLAEIRALCEVANQEVFLRDYSPHPHEERNASITEARTKLKQQARHWFPKLLRLLDEAAAREARLRESLNQYAKPEHWMALSSDADAPRTIWVAIINAGEREGFAHARAALAPEVTP